jgi:hypothetical protein
VDKGAYTVVARDDLARLEREVERLLKDGWQLVGGVSIGAVNQPGPYWRYAQALVITHPTAAGEKAE